MVEIEKLGATKRFGARYGRTNKHNFVKIEKEQRKLHKCPFCNKVAVKRLAVGIWYCRKCESKFTGKAYTIEGLGKAKEEEPMTASEEPAQNG